MKTNNRHKHPETGRQPRHLIALRKSEAMERQTAYDQLSIQEKLDRLPSDPEKCKKQKVKLKAVLDQRKKSV